MGISEESAQKTGERSFVISRRAASQLWRGVHVPGALYEVEHEYFEENLVPPEIYNVVI